MKASRAAATRGPYSLVRQVADCRGRAVISAQVALGRDRQASGGAGQTIRAIESRKIVKKELNNIAPEVDIAGVNPTADLREAIDIDSMNFLNFAIALRHRLGIPEIDYRQARYPRRGIAYIAAKLGSK